MKFSRILYFIITLLLPVLASGESQQNALFEKGNALYNKAQYAQALKIYQQVTDAGYQSAALYFNMGNASFKNGDIPSALLYYQKAHKLSPGDKDINFNIRFVNQRTTDKIDEAPEFFLSRWWHSFILGFSVSALSIISILGFMIGSGLLIIYFFANAVNAKKASFFASIVLFFVGMVAIVIAERQTAYFDGHKQAIVFSSSATAKSSPEAQAKTLFVLHEGTMVNVLSTNNDWIKISLVNGNEGWIKLSDVKEI
jgi:tetratricopeptide (TPR) repeat protein